MAPEHQPGPDHAADHARAKVQARRQSESKGLKEVREIIGQLRPCLEVKTFALRGAVVIAKRTTQSVPGSTGTCATSAIQTALSAASVIGVATSID